MVFLTLPPFYLALFYSTCWYAVCQFSSFNRPGWCWRSTIIFFLFLLIISALRNWDGLDGRRT